MLKGRDDIDRVLEIARRYNVQVFLHEEFPRGWGELGHELPGKDRRGLQVRPTTDAASEGPIWHWCDVTARTVWLHNFDASEPETFLHEVAHCIVQPPGGDIDALSEDVVLMPFERVLARQCLSPHGYKRVVAWRESTEIEWWDARREKYFRDLMDVPNYTRWWHRRQSHKQLRRMGAIKNGRVTWRPLNWKRAAKALLDRGSTTGGPFVLA